MEISIRNFPLLQCCKQNCLTEPKSIVADDEWDLLRNDIEKALQLYKGIKLQMSYVTRAMHETLLDTKKFVHAKSLLKGVPETFGYLLLPEKFKPLRVKDTADLDLEELSFDSVLFSFVKQETLDLNLFGMLDEDSLEDEDERREYLSGRWLTLLPIQNGKIRYCLRDSNIAVSEEFGTIHGHESWDAYGHVLDYIFAFLIVCHYTDTDNEAIQGNEIGGIRKINIVKEKYINETQNDIDIIFESRELKSNSTG